MSFDEAFLVAPLLSDLKKKIFVFFYTSAVTIQVGWSLARSAMMSIDEFGGKELGMAPRIFRKARFGFSDTPKTPKSKPKPPKRREGNHGHRNEARPSTTICFLNRNGAHTLLPIASYDFLICTPGFFLRV